jgi:hypothetical protein
MFDVRVMPWRATLYFDLVSKRVAPTEPKPSLLNPFVTFRGRPDWSDPPEDGTYCALLPGCPQLSAAHTHPINPTTRKAIETRLEGFLDINSHSSTTMRTYRQLSGEHL